jgi:hypothetical protein
MGYKMASPQAQSDSAFSLADCVVDLLKDAKTPPHRNDVLMALGSSLAFCVSQSPNDEIPTAADCHDFALVEAAELFGIRVRDLHPPRARAGLSESVEFTDHFADSYFPLIQRALQNNQQVLAFRGWEGRAAQCWGVIDCCDDRGQQLTGRVPGIDGSLRLSEPALQCYVVESIKPVQPDANSILICGMRAFSSLSIRGKETYPELQMASEALERLVDGWTLDPSQWAPERYVPILQRLRDRRNSAERFLIDRKDEWQSELEWRIEMLIQLCTSSSALATRAITKPTVKSIGESLKLLLSYEFELLKIVEMVLRVAQKSPAMARAGRNAPPSTRSGTMTS